MDTAVHSDIAGILVAYLCLNFFWRLLRLVLICRTVAVTIEMGLKGLDKFGDTAHIRHISHLALCSIVMFSCSLTRSCAFSNGASMM